MRAQRLLGRSERAFDGPATRVRRDDHRWFHGDVRAHPKIVVLNSRGIPTDDQQDRFVADGVPQHHLTVHQPVPGTATFIGDDAPPPARGCCDLGGSAQSLAAHAWSTALASLRWTQAIQGSITSKPGDEREAVFSQGDHGRSEGAIGAPVDTTAREPSAQRGNGLSRQCRELHAAFAMEEDQDGQSQRLSAPRGTDPQGHHQEIQAQCDDHACGRRSHGIPPPSRAGHLSASLVQEGVVEIELDRPSWNQRSDHGQSERFPEFQQDPVTAADEAMIGIMRANPGGISESIDSSDGLATWAKCPADHQRLEDGPGRGRERSPERGQLSLPEVEGIRIV